MTQLAVVDPRTLQAAFANLTASQQEWLLTRRYYATDKDCCIAMGRADNYASGAKRSSADFRYCYDLMLKGDSTLVDESLVEALTRSNLLKALIEERKILDMAWTDVADARLGGAKAQAITAAISRVKGSRHTTEHIFTVEEVMKVVEGTVRDIV